MNLLAFGILIGISVTLLSTFIILTFDHFTKKEKTIMQIVQVGKERSVVLVTNNVTNKEAFYMFNNDILTDLIEMGLFHESYNTDLTK